MERTVNVVFAGLGGQGVLTAADILAEVAFRAGHDVKKSEIHGMSQRGGSVASDVRYGAAVCSPMVPPGEADFLVAVDPSQVEVNRPALRPDGTVVSAAAIDASRLANARSMNVAVLGALSVRLDFSEAEWAAAIKARLPAKLHEANLQAFQLGRAAGRG
ncbi:MAG: indolepyruvate oxidoreductase subunit beta [Lentisphaerae bacterium ADurb.BinA184]|nr:MAG: indolepyruvate oxidoreductase subunit beta [Lentisphaerae bacterium ADurb.BinA184]